MICILPFNFADLICYFVPQLTISRACRLRPRFRTFIPTFRSSSMLKSSINTSNTLLPCTVLHSSYTESFKFFGEVMHIYTQSKCCCGKLIIFKPISWLKCDFIIFPLKCFSLLSIPPTLTRTLSKIFSLLFEIFVSPPSISQHRTVTICVRPYLNQSTQR